jgi:hypothetical protein
MKWRLFKIPSCYCVLPMQTYQPKLIKTKFHCCQSHQNYLSKLYSSTLIQKTRIPRPLSQASSSLHPNVFIFILPLTGGQAGDGWDSPNKMMRSLPHHFPFCLKLWMPEYTGILCGLHSCWTQPDFAWQCTDNCSYTTDISCCLFRLQGVKSTFLYLI